MSDTWPQTVVVATESVKSDDPYDIVESNISFVNALFEEHLRPDEIPANALRSYYVDYYLAQVNNGGFSQFIYNSRWNETLVRLVQDGLRGMNATQHLALFQENANLVAEMGPEELRKFFESEYFDENPRRDALDRNNDRFFQLAGQEDLVALNAAWLRGLPNLLALAPEEIQQEIARRAAMVPDREKRIAAARANEPRYLKLIRALSEQAGHELSHVTVGSPTHMHEGQPTMAWHFITDQGHHYMVEFNGKALMFEGESNALISEINAP